MKTQYLCFPLNIKPTTTTTTSSASNARAPPGTSSILDRFREAVFRLIMVTALSKASNNSSSSSSTTRSTTRSSSRLSSTNNHDYHRNDSSSSSNNHGHESVRRSCYLYDPYHNEALADCIEFIKKKSASSSPSNQCRHIDDEDNETTRGSTVSSDVDVVISLPVM